MGAESAFFFIGDKHRRGLLEAGHPIAATPLFGKKKAFNPFEIGMPEQLENDDSWRPMPSKERKTVAGPFQPGDSPSCSCRGKADIKLYSLEVGG